jgi:hypothetical protein
MGSGLGYKTKRPVCFTGQPTTITRYRAAQLSNLAM